MKSYDLYEKEFIGDSDIATLILVGMQGPDENCKLVSEFLDFGQDGRYHAYIVDEDAKIGSHYEKVTEFRSWLRIYDDADCTKDFSADKIVIYRAGEFGCVIQLFNRRR